MTFRLHERLAADTVRIGSLPLCELLLMNDARFPWCILVPRRDGMRDIIDLEPADIDQLHRESVALQRALRELFSPDKLNVAAIGNLVPQLHVHHVARFRTDSEWPAPVWGRGTAQPYEAAERTRRIEALQQATRAGR
ncbi:MAG: HIT domain-containing protein [Pseudomonadota bacterium]